MAESTIKNEKTTNKKGFFRKKDTNSKEKKVLPSFTRYEKFIIFILSCIQFSVILDFMVLSPLGYILIPKLHITTSKFGFVVSAYAFSAGASALLAAGFADRFDRKKILLFFYTGFIIGTALCAAAPTYEFLLGARIVTGLFGGVIGSISLAIISDLFKLEFRGRVMGFVQMAFAASQILGIPIGLFIAKNLGWHAPFVMIVAVSIIVASCIYFYMQPVSAHLTEKSNTNPFEHLWKTISNPQYLKGFFATTLLATGGFMMMPFGTVFSTHNLKISEDSLPLIFGITGVASIIVGPIIGRLSDRIGKYKMFVIGSVISILMVCIYTHLGPTPLWLVITLNVILFVGISSRMIPSSALLTGVPEPKDRGAFMSINSSVSQISGGIATGIAGMIVVQQGDGELQHYPILGFVVMGSMTLTLGLMYMLNQQIHKKNAMAKSNH